MSRDIARNIALVISDVDGTLVTTDKRVTPGVRAAVRRLGEAGIGFTVASSRPPAGLRPIAEALDLRLPMGAFNGATVVGPDFCVLAETLIPEATAREAAERLAAARLDVWVFARGAWWLRDPEAPYTDVERRTLQAEPSVTGDLGPLLAQASKIVGVSADFAHLAACEGALAAALGDRAAVHRSQAYYLDVTPPGLDKGSFVTFMADRLGLAPERIAVLGDAGNDRAMFARAGLAIAMGNADAAVQAAAGAVTADNDSDGFAQAVDTVILGA
ncbi:Cof-type HAD-IIB family hydrolase [Methylobacterium sp. A54F]